jgi:hypothetical protein
MYGTVFCVRWLVWLKQRIISWITWHGWGKHAKRYVLHCQQTCHAGQLQGTKGHKANGWGTWLTVSSLPKAVSSDILQIPSSTSFIYRILYKILSSISHFSPTTFSKSRSLYIKPNITNVFCSKFLYLRIYHTSNAMNIFYFYLIQCLKRKEKIEKRRGNRYI